MATQTRVNSGKSLSLSKLICALVIVLLAAFGGFYFYKYQDLKGQYDEANMSQEERNRKTVEEVSKLYNVPAFDDEQPTIYEVKDPEEVKENEFFADANEGDQLIVYQESDIAILYRPSENKIINSGEYRATFASKVGVAIIAPTNSQEGIENKLKANYGNLIITKSTPNGNYTKGVVVDVDGNEAEAASTLAELLGYEVGSLPSGEKAPDGAKIIIVAPSAISE